MHSDSTKHFMTLTLIWCPAGTVLSCIIMRYLLRTRKGVHSPGLPAAGKILSLDALVGIFIVSCRVEVS